MDEHLFKDRIVSSDRILYTPSSFARSTLLHLQEAGILKANKPHTSNREHLSSFLFFIVLEGSGRLLYNGTSWPLCKDDCVFINCEYPYMHETSEDLWTLRWIHFHGPQILDIYRKYTERGGSPVFRAQQPESYSSLLKDIQDTASSSDYIKDMRINEKITSLLTLCMNETTGTAFRNTPKTGTVQKIKEYIDEHYAEKITLDSLSEQFFINPYYLARRFHEYCGVTFGAYLTQVRLTHAKELLRFTGLSIDEIGVRCGLKSGAYLSRVFKKAEGIAPLEYRKQW